MRVYKHQVFLNPVPQDQWEGLELRNKIFLNATQEFFNFASDKYRFYEQYSNVDGRGIYYYNDSRSAENLKTGEIIIVLNDSKMDLLEVELSMVARIGINTDLMRNPESYDFYNNMYSRYTNLIKAKEKLDRTKRDLVAQIYGVREQEAIIRIWKNRESVIRRHGISDGIKIFKFENVTAEDTCANGDDIFLGDLEFRVDFLNMRVELIGGTQERKTDYGDVFHPHHLGGTTICMGSQTADINDAIMAMDIDIVQIILSKFAESYTSDDDAGQWWTQWTTDKAKVYMSDGEWYDQDDVVYNNNGEPLYRDSAYHIEEIDDWVDESEVRYSNVYSRYILRDNAVYSSLHNDYILSTDDDYVELENGNGFALVSHENVIEYDSKFYYRGDTVDIDGERIPSQYVVYSNPLAKYILHEDAVQFEGEWYTQETLPSPEPVAENDEAAPQTIEQVIDEATALGVLDEENKASIETVVTEVPSEQRIPTHTEELTEGNSGIEL